MADLFETIGAILGGGASKGDIETSEELITQNLRDIENLPLPDYQKMELKYALLQAGKEYTPEKLVAEQMQRDYLQGIQADPELMAKQRQYMQYLEDIAKTGMTPQETAARNQLMRQLEASQQSKMADIERQAQQTGMASSGASLLAKMTAQQQAQNVASEEADRLAAQMAQRQMGAQGALAQQAGSMEEQQYARALQKAQSKQALDQFNLQQRARAGEYNVEAMNAAQRANLARQQQVSDANIALLNKQKEAAADLEYQKFLDRLKKQGLLSEARKGEAGMREKRASRVAKEISGAGQAIGSIGKSLAGAFGGGGDAGLSSAGSQMGSGSNWGGGDPFSMA